MLCSSDAAEAETLKYLEYLSLCITSRTSVVFTNIVTVDYPDQPDSMVV